MPEKKNVRDEFATGNAAALQKLELDGFSEEIQVWAWKTLSFAAHNSAAKNHFSPEEELALTSMTLIALLEEKDLARQVPPGVLPEQYLAGVLFRRLNQAAEKIADERSVWRESRRSLDAPCDNAEDDESATLGDLLTDGSDLNVNRKYIGKPRAIAIRHEIKRLRNARDRVGLAALRARLRNRAENDTVSEDGSAPKGFGLPSAASRLFVLRMDVWDLIGTLPPKLGRLCRRMMAVEEPKTAYKSLGIEKNAYYHRVLPLLRRVFAELADAC